MTGLATRKLSWDADLGDLLAAGRLGPAPTDLAAFEAAFVQQVEGLHACADTAWDGFYDATLTRVAAGWDRAQGEGTVATFSRIWARAVSLSRGGSVLDVGTCFGFLPLAWAARRGAPRLLAMDLSPESAMLAARQAARLGRDVAVLCADGQQLPLPSGAVDTVLLLHVLEHLPATMARKVLGEALRAARERVVVAVPMEERPDPVFGHLQVFDLADLAALGESTGWHAAVHSDDGGWLVLDGPDP